MQQRLHALVATGVNGHRHREVLGLRDGVQRPVRGDPEAALGSCLPDWLLERRRRAKRVLTTVVATC